MNDPARLAALPLLDARQGLERCLGGGAPSLVVVMLGATIGWWMYVPLHELLHAWACLAGGGSVTRLEITPIYGGRLLAHWISFVVPADSGYAGRLAGFTTGGNDFVHLLTVHGPFILCVFPGVWALRASAARRRPFWFGVSIPLAFAPFVSWSGDAYEIGSILVTNLPPWSPPLAVQTLRGDSLFGALVLVQGMGNLRLWSGLVLAAALGLVWSWLVYLLGGWVAAIAGCAADHRQRGSST